MGTECEIWSAILGRKVKAVHCGTPLIEVDCISVRVKARTRMLGRGVPDDAEPGDIVVGNRGAAAEVIASPRGDVLSLRYIGNYGEIPSRVKRTFRRVHHHTGGTFRWE
jgi:hypothetical protein